MIVKKRTTNKREAMPSALKMPPLSSYWWTIMDAIDYFTMNLFVKIPFSFRTFT